MKILVDQLELSRTSRIKTLRLRETIRRSFDWIADMYFDDTRPHFFVIVAFINDEKTKVRTHLIPAASINSAIVAPESETKHQTLGTSPANDTPTGSRKKRTVATSKSAIAQRIADRESAHTE